MDRITPTRRPDGRPAGTQRWRNLLFLHWAVDPEELRGLVPASLELDPLEVEGRGPEFYVGVVPFRMHQIRPSWWPHAWAFNFLECNVRTYVHHQGEPGVYFFSLDANSRLAVMAARLGWSLPYYYARMSEDMPDGAIRYRVDRGGASLDVRYRVDSRLPESGPETEEFFFLERYLLFTERRGQLLRGQVYHTPYPAYSAEVLHVDESLLAAAGVSVEGAPAYVHYSPGVDVEVFSLARLDRA